MVETWVSPASCRPVGIVPLSPAAPASQWGGHCPREAIEVAVRMAAVLAGLRALPAVSMGCQEAQPDVLLLQ